MDVKKIAEGWIEEHSSPNIDLDPDKRKLDCWEILEDLIYERNDISWLIMLEIINNTYDELVISNLAAGPLENFIAKMGGDNIQKIEREAKLNPRLAYALRGVWQNLTPDDIWTEIQRIVRETS